MKKESEALTNGNGTTGAPAPTTTTPTTTPKKARATPKSGTGHKRKNATPAPTNNNDGDDDGQDIQNDSPTKKPRTPRNKKTTGTTDLMHEPGDQNVKEEEGEEDTTQEGMDVGIVKTEKGRDDDNGGNGDGGAAVDA